MAWDGNSMPFGSIDHDRRYKSKDWAAYFSDFIGNGVYPNPTTGMQVVADTAMNVTVKEGRGFINGYRKYNPDDYTLTISNADGVLDRIDRVVLRWSLSARDILIDVLQGTPSANPSAPALTRNADIYELALADIAVGRGITTITQSMITDLRTNTELCGIVEGVVSQIDWSTLTAQLNAFMTEYSAAIVHDYNEYVDRIDTFETTFETDANAWMTTEQADFEAWVATMHDILDTETATHLLNLIQRLTAQVGVPDAYDPDEEYVVDEYCIYNNTIYKCTKDTLGGGFDAGHWRATTVLDEIGSAIADAKDRVYEEMAKGSLAIQSRLAIDNNRNHLIVDGGILAINQTVKLQFA